MDTGDATLKGVILGVESLVENEKTQHPTPSNKLDFMSISKELFGNLGQVNRITSNILDFVSVSLELGGNLGRK